MQKANSVMRALALGFLGLISLSVIMGSGVVPGAYSLIENNGTGITRRSTLNFVSGVTCVDNAGSLRSDCTGSGGTANPTVSFTSQTSVTFTHNLNTTTPIVQCYNAAGSPVMIIPNSVTSTSVNVSTIAFSAPQSGTCVANATGGGGGGGGGSITWTALTLQNGWTFPGTDGGSGFLIQSGRYGIDSSNVVHLDGTIATGTVSARTVIATLPAGFRPVNEVWLEIGNGGGNVGTMLIYPTGDMVALSGFSGGGFFVGLTGITFPIN